MTEATETAPEELKDLDALNVHAASFEDTDLCQRWLPRVEALFAKRKSDLWYPVHFDLVRKRGYRVDKPQSVETGMDRAEIMPFPSNAEKVPSQMLGDLIFRYTSQREFLVEQIAEFKVAVQVADDLQRAVEAAVRRILRQRGIKDRDLSAEVNNHPLVLKTTQVFKRWKTELDALRDTAEQMLHNIAALSREITRRKDQIQGEMRQPG